MHTSLLVLALTPFFLLLLVTLVNNGLEVEMYNSIDVNHHMWFSNFIISHGRIPQDKTYEFMPLSLLMVPILTLMNGIYSPIYLLLRAFLPQLILILLMWVYLFGKSSKYDQVSFIFRYLSLFIVVYPISYAFYPFYLSINNTMVPIIMLVLLAREILFANRNRLPPLILYTLFFLAALFSNFSYTLIFLSLFFASEYFASILKPKLRNKIQCICELLLISCVMTLIYIAYIILAEARSFRNALIRLVTNIRDLLSGEAIEFPLKKSLVELDLVSMLISAMKIYGTLLAPYGLMLLLMLFRVFREKTLHDYDFAVLLSFFAITVLLPITGYDAFRIMNMINLLLPIVILEFIYSFNKTRGSKSFIVVMFILIFSIVGLASMVFIQFTPQGFKTLSLNVPIYFGDENSVIAEYISSVEYPVLRPRAHIVTLSYLAGHLEERTSRIIGDRVFCSGFMYVNRRDLYTS